MSRSSLVRRSIFFGVLISVVFIGIQFYRSDSASTVDTRLRPTDVNDFHHAHHLHNHHHDLHLQQAASRNLHNHDNEIASSGAAVDLRTADVKPPNDAGQEEKKVNSKKSVTEIPLLSHDDIKPLQSDNATQVLSLNQARPIPSEQSAEPNRLVIVTNSLQVGLSDNDQILAKHFQDERRTYVNPSKTDIKPVDLLTIQSAAAVTESSTAGAQRQYIPHRCPPEFDKINDTEYDWFQKIVVQRSPGTTTTFNDEILILTPISNSQKHLKHYFENICSLVYPHRLISIVLGEDSSTDKTAEVAEQLVDQLGPFFKRVNFIKLPNNPSSLSGRNQRHLPSFQFLRRRHLATVRNRLLMQALGMAGPGVRWVLWIDSDVRHIPRDLIRHLLAVNQSVVVPNCLWKNERGQTDTYDRNTWQETDLSRARLRVMGPDELMLEGYEPTRRRFLNDLKTDGDVVPVDGVGGCVLLVNADLHRSGLVFPPYVFDHHIETEGFAKSVSRFGVKMYGLPSVNVIHW